MAGCRGCVAGAEGGGYAAGCVGMLAPPHTFINTLGGPAVAGHVNASFCYLNKLSCSKVWACAQGVQVWMVCRQAHMFIDMLGDPAGINARFVTSVSHMTEVMNTCRGYLKKKSKR